MANWDNYTQKSAPEDADTLMIKDTAGAANKRTPFSGVWNWIVSKLTSAVISQLETTNKSIIPAINELNGKAMSRSIIRVQCTASAAVFITDDNATITEGKFPENRRTYIPVVVGHSDNSNSMENVFYDSSKGWGIYSTRTQYVSIMFYDVDKISHVETSS